MSTPRVIQDRAYWNEQVEALLIDAAAESDENTLVKDLAEQLHVARVAVWDYERHDAARMAALDVLADDMATAEGQADAKQRAALYKKLLGVVEALYALDEQHMDTRAAMPELYQVAYEIHKQNTATAQRRSPKISKARERASLQTEDTMMQERFGVRNI